MRLKMMTLGLMATNCYIVYDDVNALVIDPGSEPNKIIKFLQENNLNLEGILLTHGHFDHIGAVDPLVEKYKSLVYANEYTQEMIKNPKLNLSNTTSDIILKSNITPVKGEIKIADWEIVWLHLPGHCPDSSMIYFPKLKILFSGDVLFKGSIGRFDFINSSLEDTRKTISKIKRYNFDCTVYPGHGEATSLKYEQLNNYYLK